MDGIHKLDGKNHYFMKLDNLMGIMSTSECKEEAFNLIMYYYTLDELLLMMMPESFYENSSQTSGIFSIFGEKLN